MLKKIVVIAAITFSLSQALEVEKSKERVHELNQTYWGWNLGGVFSEVPISKAIDDGFAIFMSNAYYGYLFNSPEDLSRLGFNLGFYGFQIVLPVPYMGLDYFVGDPNGDIQFKASAGGFYDIVVGGHGGVAVGGGVLFKKRFNVSFFAVPLGVDAKKDYLHTVGIKDTESNCTDKGVDCVVMPYFGIFLGFQY